MSADPQLTQANLENPLEIVMTRTFAAPRELVWKAWTDAEHVGNWWGPAGFTTTTHSMDFKPGGSWNYTMHGPDGQKYHNRIEYLEITIPSRLIYKLGGDAGDKAVQFRADVSFEATGEHGEQTRVTMPTLITESDHGKRSGTVMAVQIF